MVDGETLKFLVEAGSNAFLIYLVLRLLGRIDAITDKLLESVEVVEVQVQKPTPQDPAA